MAYVWIMEDTHKTLRGGSFGNTLQGLQDDQALLVVEFLASFHAQYIAHDSVLAEFSEILFDSRSFLSLVGQTLQKKLSDLPDLALKLQMRLEPEFVHSLQYVSEKFEDLVDYAHKKLPCAVLHGDVQPEAFYFCEEEVVASEWQQATVSFAGLDLASFFVQCLSLSSRRKHYTAWMQRYLDLLLDIADPHNTEGLDLIVLDRSFKVGLAVLLSKLTVSALGSPLSTVEQVSSTKKLLARAQAAAIDFRLDTFLNKLDLQSSQPDYF